MVSNQWFRQLKCFNLYKKIRKRPSGTAHWRLRDKSNELRKFEKRCIEKTTTIVAGRRDNISMKTIVKIHTCHSMCYDWKSWFPHRKCKRGLKFIVCILLLHTSSVNIFYRYKIFDILYYHHHSIRRLLHNNTNESFHII